MKARQICPYCGSDAFESAEVCAVCGEVFPKKALMIFPFSENGVVRWLECCKLCASEILCKKKRTPLEQAVFEEHQLFCGKDEARGD